MARKRDDQSAKTRNSFLHEVCAHPAEDEPRLRYAEYLDGTGNKNDAARAEYIRIQCELARPDVTHIRYAKLQERIGALDSNRERWVQELPTLDGVRWNSIQFRRGFVWEVWCDDGDAFVKNAPTIFAAAPVQGISLQRQAQSLTRLAGAPELKHITRLILEECELEPDDAKALAASPNVVNVSHLHLFGNRLGDAGAIAIADSRYLKNLRNLDLADNGIGDAGVIALAKSPVTATLEHLGLAGSSMSVAGADALAASPYLKRLTGLTLWECEKINTKSKAMLQKRFGNAVSFCD